FLMPFYLIEIRGFSTAQTGLMLAMVPLMLLLFAPISGLLHDRTRWPQQATLGVALVSLGLFSLATLGSETHVAFVLLRLALIGVGSVVFNPPNTSTIMGSVPRSMLGTASASVATSRNVGNAVGLALGSAVVVAVAGVGGSGVSGADVPPDDLLRGIRAAFLAAASLSLLAIAVSAWRGNPTVVKQPTAPATLPPAGPR
ncbi:MAG: MFS transporter, partial [Dehalococcoidia bacterium]